MEITGSPFLHEEGAFVRRSSYAGTDARTRITGRFRISAAEGGRTAMVVADAFHCASSARTPIARTAIGIGRTAPGLPDTGMIADDHASPRTGYCHTLVARTFLRIRTARIRGTTPRYRNTRMIADGFTGPTGHGDTLVSRTLLRRRTRAVRTAPARYRHTGTV